MTVPRNNIHSEVEGMIRPTSLAEKLILDDDSPVISNLLGMLSRLLAFLANSLILILGEVD